MFGPFTTCMKGLTQVQKFGRQNKTRQPNNAIKKRAGSNNLDLTSSYVKEPNLGTKNDILQN